jgi:hypothetical protein
MNDSVTAVKAVEGKEGWLFLHNDSNGVVDQHVGKKAFSEADMVKWRHTLEMRYAWLKNKGIGYYFLIAPDTHAIYPEFLPDHIVPTATRPILQLLAHLKANNSFMPIYPIAKMQEAKKQRPVCIQTDSHWNHYGAYLATRRLMEDIQRDYPSVPFLHEDMVEFTEKTMIGDLGNKFTPPKESKTLYAKIKTPQSRVVSDNEVVNRGRIRIHENKNKDLLTAVFLRDSYGLFNADFIAESFSRLIEVHTPLLEMEMIEQEKPDIVINMLAERFFMVIPNDIRDEKAKDLAAKKA